MPLLSCIERKIIGQFNMKPSEYALMRARGLVFSGGLEPATMTEIMASVKRRQARRSTESPDGHREAPTDMLAGVDKLHGQEHIRAEPPKNMNMLKFAPLAPGEQIDPTEEDRARRQRDNTLAIRQIHASLNAIERRR